jgi:hypothetical protein
MQNLGRELRQADMEKALQLTNVNDRERVMHVLNEVEDDLALERKRMAFMVYYGRYMNMDEMGNYWMHRGNGPYQWMTDPFRSPQEAIDTGMKLAGWDNIYQNRHESA